MAGVTTDTYTYPLTSNRLGSISLAAGGTRAFTYDAAGNVIADNRGAGFGYTYDAAGRMSELRINGVLQAQYRYDFAGRQAVRTLTSTTQTIHSVFDSSGNRIAEYDQTSGALLREYVWNGLTPVAVIENGVVYFVRVDHIGRPVFATNAAGVKVWTATYTPFGEVHASTGTPIALRFPGQWFQSESGLHQNWMRDYDPTTGRYLQADPLGLVDGASVYGCAGQNSMMNIDPTGECFGPAAIYCAAAAGAAIYVIWGWLESTECDPYTWDQAGWDAVNGGFTGATVWWGAGAAWRGGRAAWSSWRGAGAADVLPTPTVVSTKLQNIVNNLYKGTTSPIRIGNGTTAEAVRHELLTGQAVGGRFHSQKAQESIRALENWLNRNPGAPYRDRLVAESLISDLRNALGGFP
jgi:RHS repeat-associated protein